MKHSFANPIFAAIDTPDLDRALMWGRALAPICGGLKLGLEFLSAHGPQGFARMLAFDAPIFADVKFHDIPNTVAGAVRAMTRAGAAIINVHASGGIAMMKAARDAAAEAASGQRPLVIGVTVLTCLDDNDLRDAGFANNAGDQSLRLAALVQEAGLDGVVCSPHEAAAIRKACGRDFTLIVPGVRPEGSARDDQKRIMTPNEALRAGADILVIGRPITEARDPVQAARAILASLHGPSAAV